MPFTPLHLGPGAVFKAIGGDRFSFMVFGGSQILIDLEPAYRMINQDTLLHGPTHTVAGAALIGSIATVIGKPVSEVVLRWCRAPVASMSWGAAAAGGFLGTFSHVFFDAIMHADMQPWRPFADGNGLLGALPIGTLHSLCIVLGMIGGVAIWLRSRRSERPESL